MYIFYPYKYKNEDISFDISVGMRRLELPTSTSRTWRASQLCYIPFFCIVVSITGAKVHIVFEPAREKWIFLQEK